MSGKMVAKTSEAAPPAKVQDPSENLSQRLVGRLALQYGVPAPRLMATLRDTVFKVKKGEQPFSDEEMAAGLIVAEKYDLNPFSKEIYFARNQWGGLLVMVGVDGWAKAINAHPQFDGVEFEEDFDDDGNLRSIWCSMYRKDRGHPTRIREWMHECRGNTGPWKTCPNRLLRHRAYIQCGRVGLGLADISDAEELERVPEFREIKSTRETVRKSPLAAAIEAPKAAPQEEDIPQDADTRDRLWAQWTDCRSELETKDVDLVRELSEVGVIHVKLSTEELERVVSAASEVIQGKRQ